mgnify:FL=1
MNSFTKHLSDQDATVEMGKQLAAKLSQATVIFLHGDLGAGKTTFSRGVIQGLGHKGNVKSPTYTLVEPYELQGINAYHFDLYRLADPEELEFMGFRDYLEQKAVCLIEWPQKGQGLLPQPDLDIELQYRDEQRQIIITANTNIGEAIVNELK